MTRHPGNIQMQTSNTSQAINWNSRKAQRNGAQRMGLTAKDRIHREKYAAGRHDDLGYGDASIVRRGKDHR